ncbi:MAG: PQQ-binding-like beta-propeller repeat protein [Verrucomicrobiota bacterium]
MKSALLYFAFCLTNCVLAHADDWPQWLGPGRNGISRETNVVWLREPVPMWTSSVGVGCSSLAIANGKAYTLGHQKSGPNRGTDTVFCFDAGAGKELWRYAYDGASCVSQDVLFDGPRSTPTVEGGRVYTLGVEGQLFCLDATTGTVIWSRHLGKDFQGRLPVYGYCCSPVVYRDLLILEVNASGASYMALNKTNGNAVWKLAGGEVTCGSPVLTTVEGLDWVVFSGGGSIMGAEAISGRQLWRHHTWGYCWVGPVVWSNVVFMANASLPRGCGVFEVRDFNPQVLWEDRGRKYQTLHCNAVIWQGHIYGVDNTGTDYQGTDSKKSLLKCLDLRTGEVKWTRERVGWGNVLTCDGKLLVLRETGELMVGQASPDGWHELLRAQILPGPTWSVPALSNGRLFCRNKAGNVVSVQITAPPGSVPAEKLAREAPSSQSSSAITSKAVPVNLSAPKAAVSEAETGAPTWNPDRTNSKTFATLEWPRFRGPGGLGRAAATNLPLSWDVSSGRGIIWKTEVPVTAPSSPVLWGKRLFLTGATPQKREVYCYDTETGRLQWRREILPAPGGPRPRLEELTKLMLAGATPVVDGQHVCAIFGTGDLACLTLDGEPVWSRSFGLPKNPYGHAASLDCWRNLLVIQLDQGEPDANSSKLIAVDIESGQTVWESRRPVPASWSTPYVARLAGRDQLITCGGSWVISYAPDSGTELWRAEFLGGEVVPSPIHAAGLVLAGAVDGKFVALRADGRGDVTKSHAVWAVEDDVPAICSPVATEQRVFLVNSDGRVLCYRMKDGVKLWEQDTGSHFQASPTIAGDRLYLLSDSGTMFILGTGERLELLGRAEVGQECVASPAFQPGRIYIRGKQDLICFGVP